MFTARLATALVLLAVFVSAMLYLPNPWWTALIVPVLLIGSWEWGALAGLTRAGRRAFVIVVLVSGLAAVWAATRLSGGAVVGTPTEFLIYGAGCLFWLLAAPFYLARRWHAPSPTTLAVVGWIVLVPAWLAMTRLQLDAGKLLALLGIIWVSDTAAYFSGTRWGRHKLAPSISPGKSWEGVAGAAMAVAVYYVALSTVAPAWGWWDGVGGAVLFASVAVMGIVGDLFESWIKRQAAVKDSGTLLPGHGGVLDRIDSLTAALPVAALLLPFAG
jgi:phosphatidate cytidylyltransferase